MFDVAQICQKGHVVNSYSQKYPEYNQKFCSQCGEPTTTQCESCKSSIQGSDLDGFAVLDYERPNFCKECGQAFPWTEYSKQAAHDLALEFHTLDEQDRAVLDESIDALMKDSPSTPLAATRFKRIMEKAGKTALPMFLALLIDIVSETGKKLVFP